MKYKNEFKVLESMCDKIANMELEILAKQYYGEDVSEDKKIFDAIENMHSDLCKEFGYDKYVSEYIRDNEEELNECIKEIHDRAAKKYD